MVVANESMLGGRIVDFTPCPMYSCAHLNGPGEFALLLYNVHGCLLCSHDFATIENVRGNPLDEWGV